MVRSKRLVKVAPKNLGETECLAWLKQTTEAADNRDDGEPLSRCNDAPATTVKLKE